MFSYHSMDPGFCRIYYTYTNAEKKKSVYCFQDEGDRFGGVKFYSCSQDGEPSYESAPKDWSSITPPKQDKEWPSELVAKVTEYILTKQNEVQP